MDQKIHKALCSLQDAEHTVLSYTDLYERESSLFMVM